VLRQNVNLKQVPYDLFFTLLDLVSFVKDIPFDARDLLQLLKFGKFRIQFEHRGLGPLITAMDELVTRIVFAIVLASLIIGSSLVILSDIPPRLYDLPVIGLVGFVLAGIIGFSLLFSIIRQKRF
jgi:ubiquinone biosynthesis protein